jgi:hypothetical protein
MEYSHLPLFANAGVTAVRHRDAKVRLSYPERTPSGVYKIYESMNLRTAKHYDYLDKARIFIEKAMERRAAYSLWFHPSDPIQIFDHHLRAILRYVDSERKNGRLWVTTMGDIAAYCEARERVRITVQRESNKLILLIHSSLDVAKHGTPEITLLIPGSSTPQSASLELVNGDQVPVSVHPVQEASTSRFMVTIPVNAKCLQLAL